MTLSDSEKRSMCKTCFVPARLCTRWRKSSSRCEFFLCNIWPPFFVLFHSWDETLFNKIESITCKECNTWWPNMVDLCFKKMKEFNYLSLTYKSFWSKLRNVNCVHSARIVNLWFYLRGRILRVKWLPRVNCGLMWHSAIRYKHIFHWNSCFQAIYTVLWLFYGPKHAYTRGFIITLNIWHSKT